MRTIVVQRNLLRRDLTPSQRAQWAAELATATPGGDRRSEDFKTPTGALIGKAAKGVSEEADVLENSQRQAPKNPADTKT
jgi:hypothetical protein